MHAEWRRSVNQLTLRQIPRPVEEKLRLAAKQTGQSINKTAIFLLRKALGLETPPRRRRHLRHLAGRWSRKQAADFQRNLKIFEEIDGEVWKQ
jgi:plasmid stability protein